MRGEGDMFRGSMNESELNEKEKLLISHYRKMSSNIQLAFDMTFKNLTGKWH